jgi:hypothetical protein
MKRIALCMMALVAAAGIATAQTSGTKAADNQAATQTTVKIEGKLALINGEIGIQVKDKTYYLQMPKYLFGFIDGLKEGAQVKIEGYEFADTRTPGYSFLRATKLSFNGKDYDLSGYGRGMGRGGMMGGRGFDDNGPAQGRGPGMMGRGRAGR